MTVVVVAGADPREVTALAVAIGDRTDYVFTSRTGLRKMHLPSAKLMVEAEIAVIRVNGVQIESERITHPPAWGDFVRSGG